ncbi:hypothetical protein D9756_007076 [Leucocoprinus leucothites]|uniref:Uncharacterized protein n=1 Tax=Leucocoprinus leucothites TaxID=201217 RepID=A0A8H5D855_9AGAR|nr:hypothetical protein D9756_007076 [Leucoagaricus leucothites]
MSGLPNPDVYLNHLPPEQATQFEASRNLCLAVLGATIWDILIYVPDDIRIVRRGPIHVVTLCFFTSRIFSLLFILLSVIEQTHTVANCSGMAIAIGVMIVIGTSSTAFLFLQRVRAVYGDNRWVQIVFSFLWLATSGVMTVVIYSQQATHIPGTEYCFYSHVEQYMSAAAMMSGFYDTLVFFAISYKIASSHSNLDDGITWDTLISGRALPRLSRSILRGGQQYYLIIMCLNLPVGILIVIPQIPPIYKLILSFPFVPLTASMACRVFRNIKIEDMMREGQTVLSDVNFATRPGLPSQKSLPHPPNVRQLGIGYQSYTSSLPADHTSSVRSEDHSMATVYGKPVERKSLD